MSELKRPTISQIDRSLRKFSDYSHDVLNSDMNTFKDRVHFLMAYCKTDPVFSIIHNQLVQADDAELEAWYAERLDSVKGMVGSGELIFPVDEDARISTMYWLLRKVDSNELEADNFSHNFYASSNSKINDYIRFFTDTVVEPLKRDLEYRFEEMMEELPSDPYETVPLASIQIIHSAQNVIQQSAHGSNIQQNAELNVENDIGRLFSELREEIIKSISELKCRDDALEIAAQAEELVLLDPPKSGAAKRLLSMIPTMGNIGSIVGGITGVLGL